MSDLSINQNEQAREAERAVLGGLMLETHRFDTVIQVIKENDFDGRDHQIIFQSMSELIEENKPLDPLTVSEKLDNKNQEGAKPKQKSAAKKMEQMSQSMSSSMQGGEMEQMEEDAKALRQILDNLLTFSFDEESLIKTTKETQSRSLQFNRILKKQQELKNQFKHIDDSLFAVSLRNPMISEIVLNEIGEIHYNLDKTLETLADNNIQKGASHQQYVLSSANKLADFLSNVQNQMQMQMSGQGQGKPKPGKGQGMQLPDIIKKQEGLGEKMKDGMNPGDKEGQGKKPGEKGKEGKEGQGAQEGEGENGSEGNAGKVLQILKEQQQLREALQNELNKKGLSGVGQSALDKMKEIEKQLINKGFKNETLQKMLNLKHELLKLEKAIQQQVGSTFEVQTREQQHAILLRAIKIEKLFVFILMAFIMGIASFTLFYALSLLVIEKRKDLRTLLAMGITPQQLLRIFLFVGLFISFSGAIVGMGLGFGLGWIQQTFGIIPLGIPNALIDSYPIQMEWFDFLMTAVVVIVITFLASIIPARKAVQMTFNQPKAD